MSGCGRDVPAAVGTETIPAADRQEALTLSGSTLDGDEAGVQDFRGKVVVLNNWASWCEPCREEMPGLVSLAEAQPEVQVLGLNVTDEPQAAAAFADELGITFPSIVDSDGSLLRTIPGVPPAALPSTVVLDPDGRIAARVIGPATLVQLKELVAAAATTSP